MSVPPGAAAERRHRQAQDLVEDAPGHRCGGGRAEPGFLHDHGHRVPGVGDGSEGGEQGGVLLADDLGGARLGRNRELGVGKPAKALYAVPFGSVTTPSKPAIIGVRMEAGISIVLLTFDSMVRTGAPSTVFTEPPMWGT